MFKSGVKYNFGWKCFLLHNNLWFLLGMVICWDHANVNVGKIKTNHFLHAWINNMRFDHEGWWSKVYTITHTINLYSVNKIKVNHIIYLSYTQKYNLDSKMFNSKNLFRNMSQKFVQRIGQLFITHIQYNFQKSLESPCFKMSVYKWNVANWSYTCFWEIFLSRIEILS